MEVIILGGAVLITLLSVVFVLKFLKDEEPDLSLGASEKISDDELFMTDDPALSVGVADFEADSSLLFDDLDGIEEPKESLFKKIFGRFSKTKEKDENVPRLSDYIEGEKESPSEISPQLKDSLEESEMETALPPPPSVSEKEKFSPQIKDDISKDNSAFIELQERYDELQRNYEELQKDYEETSSQTKRAIEEKNMLQKKVNELTLEVKDARDLFREAQLKLKGSSDSTASSEFVSSGLPEKSNAVEPDGGSKNDSFLSLPPDPFNDKKGSEMKKTIDSSQGEKMLSEDEIMQRLKDNNQ